MVRGPAGAGTATQADRSFARHRASSATPFPAISAVTRVAGADRYATAAAIAGEIESDANWCGSAAVSAMLVNGATDMLGYGATDMLGYGVAAQTTAHRLQMPVLMTAADERPGELS